MKTITLGESGLECSRLAYGCWRVTGVIHHPPIDEEHEKKSHESIKAAFDAGYTLFDLSDVDSDGLVDHDRGGHMVVGREDNEPTHYLIRKRLVRSLRHDIEAVTTTNHPHHGSAPQTVLSTPVDENNLVLLNQHVLVVAQWRRAGGDRRR